MPVLPRSDRTLMTWMQTRLPAWGEDPAAIGLDETRVIELAALAEEAEVALLAAEQARQAAEDATLRLHEQAAALRARASAAVGAIKAHADTTDDPNVYAAASIPPDRPKAPLGPPPAPTGVSTTLEPGGTVLVAWRGTRKGGTTFAVERALVDADGTIGPFTLIDTTTDKSWRDTAVPAGQRGVHYRIIAQRRGGRSSPSNLATLSFGTEPTASQARLAA